MARFSAREGGPGCARMVTILLPMMRKAVVKEETIREITMDSPWRYLAQVPKDV